MAKTEPHLFYLSDFPIQQRKVRTPCRSFEPTLRGNPVISGYPDQVGRTSLPPNYLGREPAMKMLRKAGGSRVAV